MKEYIKPQAFEEKIELEDIMDVSVVNGTADNQWGQSFDIWELF